MLYMVTGKQAHLVSKFVRSKVVFLSVWVVLPAGGQQHRGCIIPQAVTHSLVLLKMGEIIARNMLS